MHTGGGAGGLREEHPVFCSLPVVVPVLVFA
jgi:hypothetical protein